MSKDAANNNIAKKKFNLHKVCQSNTDELTTMDQLAIV